MVQLWFDMAWVCSFYIFAATGSGFYSGFGFHIVAKTWHGLPFTSGSDSGYFLFSLSFILCIIQVYSSTGRFVWAGENLLHTICLTVSLLHIIDK